MVYRNGLWRVAAAVAAVFAFGGVAVGTVTLDLARDLIHLSDGRVVECTVILKGKESVTVLVGEDEKTFAMSGVVRIERGVFSGERRTFETGPVEGHEVITPEGGGDGDVVEPAAPPAPPPPVKTVKKQPAKAGPPPAAPAKKAGAGTGAAGAGRKNRGGARNKPKAGTEPVSPAKRKTGLDGFRRPKVKEKAEELIDQLEELKKRFQKEND